jgi:hypothetical protein
MPPTPSSRRFQHDCDACTYLGEFRGQDLYFCDECSVGPTVIARYGSDGRQYTSGMELAAVDPLLGEAQRRALERGLMHADAASRADQPT